MTQTIPEQADILLSALSVLESISLEASNADVMRTKLESLSAESEPPTNQQLQILEQVNQELLATELACTSKALVAVLPHIADPTLYQYARFLIRGDIKRSFILRDHFECVMTRLASWTDEHGVIHCHDREDMQLALDYILDGSHIALSDKDVSHVQKHFEEARAQLAAVDTLKKFFDEGHYIDLRGYTMSLGSWLVHPDVLYETVSFNVILAKHINQLRQFEGLSESDLEAELDRQNRAVESILNVDRNTPTPVRIQKREVQPIKVPPAKPVRQAKPRSPRVYLAVALVLTVLATLGLEITNQSSQLLAARDLVRISPYLIYGHTSKHNGLKVFSGRFSDRWGSQSQSQREQHARDVSRLLKSKGYDVALIAYRDRIAVRLEEGKPVVVHAIYVQPNSTGAHGPK